MRLYTHICGITVDLDAVTAVSGPYRLRGSLAGFNIYTGGKEWVSLTAFAHEHGGPAIPLSENYDDVAYSESLVAWAGEMRTAFIRTWSWTHP